MQKYSEEMEYNLSINNPASRVLDLWKWCTSIYNKSDKKEPLDELKVKKQWREQIIKKLKPADLRKDITESLNWIGPEGRALWDDDLEFYKRVKQTAID